MTPTIAAEADCTLILEIIIPMSQTPNQTPAKESAPAEPHAQLIRRSNHTPTSSSDRKNSAKPVSIEAENAAKNAMALEFEGGQ